MVKAAKEGNGGAAAQRNPEAEERKRLKKLSISNKLVAETPAAAPAVALAPSKTVIKHHGKDILKKSSRKNRFLFSFPGLLAPISGGKIGELKDLGSKNPILYLDFPQGQMKLFGTIVYPKNRYLTLQFSRGGKNVMCEDYFDTLIVFSEAWWIGRKEENPDEVRLELPEDLNMGQQPEYDFKGGAGSTSEKLRVIDRDETKFVKQQSPKREDEHESSDSQNDLKDLMQVTPTRHSARTARKSYKFAEPSSGDDSEEIDAERSEEEDTADILGTSTTNQSLGKTECSSAVAFDVDNKYPEASTNYSDQLPQSDVSATKSKDPSSKKHGSLVQATISTLFKKVEEKKAPEKLKRPTSSKVSHKKLEAESNEKTDQTKIRTPRTKGKAVKQKAGTKGIARKKEPEVDDDEIEEFSSMSQDTDESEEEWGA